MKLINEMYPVRALKTKSFLALVGPNIGWPLLLNHTEERIRTTVHLAKAISKRGTD